MNIPVIPWDGMGWANHSYIGNTVYGNIIKADVKNPNEPISYNGIDYQQRYSICPSNFRNGETPTSTSSRKPPSFGEFKAWMCWVGWVGFVGWFVGRLGGWVGGLVGWLVGWLVGSILAQLSWNQEST